MMASAANILLGQIPVGDWITYALPDSLQLRNWAQWIIMVPNAAVQRAVLIGACGGAFASGLRLWLGIGTRG
jgi:ABC-type antimicrobial peptide transport system permease subunit